MARCGCSGTSCSCVVTGGSGITVTGSGSEANPYVVTGGGALEVEDSDSVDLTLTGDGSLATPYVLSADATIDVGDLVDVDDTSLVAGNVLAVNATATGYELVPPSTATPGAITVAGGIDGDGSGGDPLTLLLDGGDPDSGLNQSASGVKVAGAGSAVPYTPLWSGSSVNPDIGNGTIDAAYIRFINLCFLSIDLTVGSTTARGSGFWNFDLPPGNDAVAGRQQIIPLSITTPTNTGYSGYAILNGGSATIGLYISSGSTALRLTNSTPSAFVAGTRLNITGMYEVAP